MQSQKPYPKHSIVVLTVSTTVCLMSIACTPANNLTPGITQGPVNAASATPTSTGQAPNSAATTQAPDAPDGQASATPTATLNSAPLPDDLVQHLAWGAAGAGGYPEACNQGEAFVWVSPDAGGSDDSEGGFFGVVADPTAPLGYQFDFNGCNLSPKTPVNITLTYPGGTVENLNFDTNELGYLSESWPALPQKPIGLYQAVVMVGRANTYDVSFTITAPTSPVVGSFCTPEGQARVVLVGFQPNETVLTGIYAIAGGLDGVLQSQTSVTVDGNGVAEMLLPASNSIIVALGQQRGMNLYNEDRTIPIPVSGWDYLMCAAPTLIPGSNPP